MALLGVLASSGNGARSDEKGDGEWRVSNRVFFPDDADSEYFPLKLLAVTDQVAVVRDHDDGGDAMVSVGHQHRSRDRRETDLRPSRRVLASP